PWLRNNFKHKNLLTWVSENRGKLIWAGLTLAQSWIAAGRPNYTGQVLGSFEEWSNVVGGILQHCGIDGFLGNLASFYKEADQEADTYLRFVHAWNEKWGAEPVGSSDLFELAVESGIELGKGGDRSAKTRLGLILSKMRDRVFDGLTIEKGGVVNGNQKWLLVQKPPF
ncbi:MAG TPA: ATPase, partial [Bdellovibrionales bacterium]|nr:ATPase [Bdellovibrionales bacterium]